VGWLAAADYTPKMSGVVKIAQTLTMRHALRRAGDIESFSQVATVSESDLAEVRQANAGKPSVLFAQVEEMAVRFLRVGGGRKTITDVLIGSFEHAPMA